MTLEGQAVTQPLPPAADTTTACTAHRFAANVWVRGVAHPVHHCTIAPSPHPTQPHVCDCGDAWPGVGIVQCAECLTVLPLTGVRKADDGKGAVVYLCVDRARCGVPSRETPARVGLDTVAAGDVDDHTTCDPADCDVAAYVTEAAAAQRLHRFSRDIPTQRQRPESDPAGPGVPIPTDGPPESAAAHLTAALALLTSVDDVVRGTSRPEAKYLRAQLGRVRLQIRMAQGHAEIPPPPLKRVPGQIRHGEIQNGGMLT